MPVITEKTIYSQLRGSAAGAIAATAVGEAILCGCAVFCGTQLGWSHLFSIIFTVCAALCGCLLLFFIVKAVAVRNHPVLKRNGGAAALARRINEGMRSPVYYAETLGGGAPFATLMTEDFIVGGVELTSFMELRDLRTVHVGEFQNVHRIVVGDPLMTAGSLVANRISDNYLASKGINSESRFDMVIFDDARGKQYRYSVQHKDMEEFLNRLSQTAPHIQFVG